MAAGSDSVSAYPIRSVDRVCDILDSLANSPVGVTLTEVADATSLPKSSVFRYLTALEARHYVERDPDAVTYRLGPAFRPQHTRGIERLAEFARPLLSQLRDKLGETTNLGVLDGTSVVHALVCESHQMMRLAARPGDRGQVHATALGKAICATLPQDRVLSILDAAGMQRFTERTITDQRGFLAELDTVRQQGFGVDEEENQPGGRCVAVAIPRLPFAAGVSVSALASRLPIDELPAVVRQLKRVASMLSRQMAG